LADKSEIAMIWRHPTICGAVKENKTTVSFSPLRVVFLKFSFSLWYCDVEEDQS